MTVRSMVVVSVLALAAVGCGEKPQTGATAKKSDAQPWATAATPYAAPDWKGGDEAAWEAQMRTRAQGQNEYSRIAATATTSASASAPAKAP